MPCHGMNAKGEPCKRPTKGDWCPSHMNGVHSGAGIWDDTKRFVKDRVNSAIAKGPRTSASTRLQKFLDSNEGHTVVKVELGRKPIVPLIHKAMDKLSFGRFTKVAKKLKYDQVYHNYLLVTLNDGRRVKLEKNQTVVETKATSADYENEIWDIPLKGKTHLTIKGMIDTAAAGNETQFYKYRADSDNCQRFTRDLIDKNGLLPEDNPAHTQVQNARHLISTLPGGSFIPNLITDAASIADRAFHGDGVDFSSQTVGLAPQHAPWMTGKGVGRAGVDPRVMRSALLQQYL